MEGKLHSYHPTRHLNLFEYLPYKPNSDSRPAPPNPENVLLFIGGLFDTFNLPKYVHDLVELFPIHSQQKWRVMHIQLSSTIRGWGISDIDQDIEQIGRCVEYIRRTYGEKTNVVLMGHSTGCQDTMHYLTADNPPSSNKPVRPKVQGAILQAPVSDREGIIDAVNGSPESKQAFEKCMEMIEKTPEAERRNTILPLNLMKGLFGPAPVSMTRFLSLASPGSPNDPASEDFFSSDLHDARLQDTFGRIAKNGLVSAANGQSSILILISDADAHMPEEVDKLALLSRWKGFIEKGGAVCSSASTSIPHAAHDIGGDDIDCREARLVTMRGAVLEYLDSVAGAKGEQAKQVYESRKKQIEMERQQGGSVGKDLNALKL